MLYLGIDQHRKQLTISLRNQLGDVVARRQVSTQWERVRAFLAEVQLLARAEGYVAMVEICGFNDWLLKLLEEYGCREIIVVQPEKQSKKKTDRRDAHALSECLWSNRERLAAHLPVQGIRRVEPAGPRDAEARQLTELRKRLGQLRTRTINKVKQILRKHNLEQHCPTKGLDTQRGRAWLAELALGPMDRLEMTMLLEQWELWDKQIEKLDLEIRRRQAVHPVALVLATIPGCAAYSSLCLAARIGPIERFPRPESLANFWGLTPSCANSGDTTGRLGPITKQGSATARFILGQLVLHVLRKDAAMRAWYKKIKQRRGSKIARVAVMRRLTTIIWHMVKNGEAYALGGRRPPQEKVA